MRHFIAALQIQFRWSIERFQINLRVLCHYAASKGLPISMPSVAGVCSDQFMPAAQHLPLVTSVCVEDSSTTKIGGNACFSVLPVEESSTASASFGPASTAVVVKSTTGKRFSDFAFCHFDMATSRLLARRIAALSCVVVPTGSAHCSKSQQGARLPLGPSGQTSHANRQQRARDVSDAFTEKCASFVMETIRRSTRSANALVTALQSDRPSRSAMSRTDIHNDPLLLPFSIMQSSTRAQRATVSRLP